MLQRKIVLALILFSASLSAHAFDRGELLYQNHCQECHDGTVHTRKDRLVESPGTLRAWVISWIVHNGLNWSEEEVADITAYLDQRYYRFTE